MTRHDGPEDRWFDRDAGRGVRANALTTGRRLPSGGESFDLIVLVVGPSDRMPEQFRPGPEHRQLLSLCRRPTPIVDLTSEIDLPLGVVRVLLGDLISEGLVGVLSTQKRPATDQRLLRMVLDGLESL